MYMTSSDSEEEEDYSDTDPAQPIHSQTRLVPIYWHDQERCQKNSKKEEKKKRKVTICDIVNEDSLKPLASRCPCKNVVALYIWERNRSLTNPRCCNLSFSSTASKFSYPLCIEKAVIIQITCKWKEIHVVFWIHPLAFFILQSRSFSSITVEPEWQLGIPRLSSTQIVNPCTLLPDRLVNCWFSFHSTEFCISDVIVLLVTLSKEYIHQEFKT